MEKKNPLNEVLQESMAKVREMVDTNTIVGQPIQTADGVTLIPISRVSFGFGGGGTAFGSKKEPAADPSLGTALGAGVKVEPVSFLIIKDGSVRVLPVAAPAVNTASWSWSPTWWTRSAALSGKRRRSRSCRAPGPVGAAAALPAGRGARPRGEPCPLSGGAGGGGTLPEIG